MSFLNELKSQAHALQSRQEQNLASLEKSTGVAEAACRQVLHYLQDLARHLNVLGPAAPPLSLDGKTQWPPLRLHSFRVDARKKMLRSQEVHDYLAMGWQIGPAAGQPVPQSIKVNFPPELERVESRLALGMVEHERIEHRHPEKNTLLAVEFCCVAQTRGNITVTPDHEAGMLKFRLLNLSGFGVVNTAYAADQVQTHLLDDLARLVVSQPSRFV